VDGSLLGGNSNWRGPIWFPINFLIVEALERYAHFYGVALAASAPHAPRCARREAAPAQRGPPTMWRNTPISLPRFTRKSALAALSLLGSFA